MPSILFPSLNLGEEVISDKELLKYVLSTVETMPWWGKSSEPREPPPPAATDFTSSDESMFPTSDAPSSTHMPSSGGASEIQQFSMVLQQQMLVQKAMSLLSDKAFEKCVIGKPSDRLSSREKDCINATVGKWMDTNEFMIGRLERKSQNASS